MRRNSNADILPRETVRDVPNIAPPSGGLQRSSMDTAPIAPRVPTHAPASHAMSPIAALAGAGSGMSCGWRKSDTDPIPGGLTTTFASRPSAAARSSVRIRLALVLSALRTISISYVNVPSFHSPRYRDFVFSPASSTSVVEPSSFIRISRRLPRSRTTASSSTRSANFGPILGPCLSLARPSVRSST